MEKTLLKGHREIINTLVRKPKSFYKQDRGNTFLNQLKGCKWLETKILKSWLKGINGNQIKDY